MTVSSQTSRVDYAGDGVTAIFPVPFYFLENTHLQVILSDDVTGAETVLVLNTDYTVTGAGALSGGSITVPNEPAVGFTLTILRSVPVTQETDYVPNDPFPAESHERALDKLTMIAQQQSTDSAGAIKVAVSDPEPSRLPPAASRALRLMGFDSLGNPIAVSATADSAAALALDLLNDTDPAKGAGQVGYSPGITVREKLESFALDAVVDFGCDPTGLTNTTVEMKAFFDECIASGSAGYIPAGDYLITTGQLIFDTPFIDKLWPNIETAGYKAVRFLAADGTNAPFITVSNGTATSGSGKYWLGGSIGGITFDQNGQSTGANQHGLSLRGMFGTKFGWMKADDIGGSTIHFPTFLFGGTNPDPYAMTFCEFEAAEANRVGGRAFDNQNYLGVNVCRIKVVRAIETLQGGIFGLGAGNTFDLLSMGSCFGRAIDDGTNVDATGGAPSRANIGIAELDNMQYGIRLNRTTDFRYEQIRFVHRFQFGVNTSAVYWPLIAFDMANGASANTSQVNGFAQHRLEAGGTLGNLGIIIKGNGAGAFTAFDMDNKVFDNGSLGFTDANLFTNIGSLDFGVIRRDKKPVSDTRVKVAALVRSSTSDTINNSGFATAAAKIVFATKLYDRGNYYDTTNSWYTVPYTGLYRVHLRFALTVAIGTRVRYGFGADVASVITTILAAQSFQQTAAAEHYETSALVSLTVGQRIFAMADQNTGAPVAMSAPFSTTADLTWSIEAI